MKLFTKTSLYYLVFSLPVLIIAGFVSYYFITRELKENTDELLRLRMTQVEKYLVQDDSAILSILNLSGELQISRLNHTVENSIQYRDTLLYEQSEKEWAPYRILIATDHLSSGNYSIKLFRSTVEYDNLIFGISSSLFLVLLFLLLSYFIINLLVSRLLWRPFYKTVAHLQTFRLDVGPYLPMEHSTTKEFNALNRALNDMMRKMTSDFLNQKQFTENASHELQTPLAVIQTKIELLIQSDKLGSEEMNLIKIISDSVNKLSRVNKSLLLLSKIENRQFANSRRISLNKTITNCLVLFEDPIVAKNISLITRLHSEVLLTIHPDLCEILISNLLQNAIRHNNKNGIIDIELVPGKLTISNTGDPLTIRPGDLFKRFRKNSSSFESIGLGLAVVKEICDASNLSILYTYGEGVHSFTLSF